MNILTVDDILKLVNEEIAKIDDVRLHYELRLRKIQYIGNKQPIKVIIALAKLKLPITSNLVNAILGSPDHIAQIHNFGDKHLLILKRQNLKCFEWIPSDLLLNLIDALRVKQ